jgi:hypothetical protein
MHNRHLQCLQSVYGAYVRKPTFLYAAGCLEGSLWRATAVVFYEVLKCIMYATLLQL